VTLLLEGDTVLKRRDEAESALAAIRRIWPLESESQD
jgi:5-(carboxyamino)imidazole ribonucleotide synthase